MNLFRPRRVTLFAALAAVPFVVLPQALTWSVGPLARSGARLCRMLMPDFSIATESRDDARAPYRNAEPGSSGSRGEENIANDSSADVDAAGNEASKGGASSGPDRRSARVGARGPTSGSRGANGASIASIAGALNGEPASRRAKRAHVFVGPESIQRAIPAQGRPTSVWTNRTAEHPAGLLIQTTGALGGVIEPGDILVEAEGQPLGSFEQLIVTVKQAYEHRAKRLSGRIFRRGDWVPVTVEPGW